RLEALRDLIDTRRAGDPSGADALTEAAGDFRARYPKDPAGPYYLASAQLTSAQDRFFGTGDKAALCTALPGIDRRLQEGAQAPGSFAPNYAALAANLAGMRQAGGCS